MRIQEISGYYDITVHALRHYEKLGLLSPEYGSNGYRIFSCEDIKKLNIIRDLRSLEISLPTIKDHLDNRTIESTKLLLTCEMEYLQEEMMDLRVKKRRLKDRLELLNFSEMKKHLELEHNIYQDRRIILSQESSNSHESLCLNLKKLLKKFEKELFSCNQNKFGIVLPSDDHICEYKVFYCLSEKEKSNGTTLLPAGNYLTIYYKGESENRSLALKSMKEYLKKQKLITEGLFYEFYLIDFCETNIPSEYVTKIEVQLK